MFTVSGIVASVRTYNDRQGRAHAQVQLVEEKAGVITASWKMNGSGVPRIGQQLQIRPTRIVVNTPPQGGAVPVLLCEEEPSAVQAAGA